MTFNVLILSAGIGSRLKSDSIKPKSLIEINNITLIEKIIDDLMSFGLKNFYITVGYKKTLIKKKLRKYEKKINIKYIDIKNFKKVGSSSSFYEYKKYWKKNKKDTLFIHSDLFCDKKLIKAVIKSKYKNIIGSFQKRSNLSKKGWLIKSNINNKIKKIYKTNYIKNTVFSEVSCINKFSSSSMKRLFTLMNFYLKNISNEDTWEILINKFISDKKMTFYTNSTTSSFWFNINTKSDLKNAKEFSKKMKNR